MPRAICLIRDKAPYRRAAFAAGLDACGFKVEFAFPGRVACDDVLVIWNRYGTGARVADLFERAGRPVIVAENAYVPHPSGAPTYAIALDHHNGAGRWPVGGPERWASWGVELAPWRDPARPGVALVAPQRGIGPPGVAQPARWVERVLPEVAARARGGHIVRAHPGRHAPPVPLADHLAAAAVVVVWASRVGIEALLAGVPVVHGLERWIGAPAAGHGLKFVSDPRRGDRLAMFERLAWAQWRLEEIAAGVPFRRLLLSGGQAQGPADL